MSTPDLKGAFDIADVLGSSVDPTTGANLLQTGSLISGEDPRDGTEVWQPAGYVGRPANATPAGSSEPTAAPQAFCVVRGDQDIALGFRDLTASALVESLGPGEVQVFAGGPANAGTCKLVLNNDGNGNFKVTITTGTAVVQVTSDSNGTVNVTAKTVNLGSTSPSDQAALASKTDANFSAIVNAIQGVTPSPQETGLAALKAALASLPNASVKSATVNISS